MMLFNLIHRPEAPDQPMYEAFRFQVDAAHRCGLKATNLLSYQGLTNERVVEDLKRCREDFDDELGIHFHEYQGDAFRQHFPKLREPAFWLNSMENKRRIVDLFMETFETQFGFLPASLGSYYFDAPTLRYIVETYPSVTCVIATCFQEGCNMFRGTGSNWHLFNEGGPWWPWYPSKAHTLCPAENEEEAIGLVAVPHLVRDMVMSINDRNDYFASHPGNILRGKAYDGPGSRYDLNLIDQYAAQDRYNAGYAYLNIFVSLPWLSSSFAFEETVETVRDLYVRELEHVAEMREQGKARDCTMQEFAAWFREHRAPGQMDFCYWQDVLCGSSREAFWPIGSHYRACVDSALGGAICDLRPYAGRLDRPTGPDGSGLWFGSYPFLLNAHKRGGEPPHYGRASVLGTVVSDGEHSANACHTRVGMQAFDPDNGVLTLEPLSVAVGERTVRIQNRYVFSADEIRLETDLLEAEGDGPLTVTHYLSGSVGMTEYPEDIRGIQLRAEGDGGEAHLETAYASDFREVAGPTRTVAEIPQLNIDVSLLPADTADRGRIVDEHLFCPYFDLSLSKDCRPGDTFASRLRIRRHEETA